MKIQEILLNNFDTKIKNFFNQEKLNDWKNEFIKSSKSISHDEPWLTLIACYSIFGNYKNISDNKLKALSDILNESGLTEKFKISSISEIRLEEKLKEIKEYNNYLRNIFKKENFHLYPDRRKIIDDKLKKSNSSFEGNTNLDLKIICNDKDRSIHLFIEAKFLSDISYQITYNPVRDQIIRNIDNGIDYVLKNNLNFKDFYFLLLTPKIFRAKEFGLTSTSKITNFNSNKSRLYCYKMKEYKVAKNIINALPHRKNDKRITHKDWQTISKNIGWITFDDFYKYSQKHNTISNKNENKQIEIFFKDRNLI